jgi:hypothetical protein
MTYPYKHENISYQINILLKKYQIEANLEAINKLSKIIKNTIEFNKKLYDIGTLKDVSLATTVEDLILIFILRSEVYHEMGYANEFPEAIKGLNFDQYDECSAIVYSKRNNVITGTCRLIFDLAKKLPIDNKFSLDYLRNNNRSLVEASRVIIKNIEGLKPEFKLLTIDSYKVLASYKMDAVSVMTEEHIRLYKKFGGLDVEKKFESYGTLKQEFFLTLWQTSNISPFFKRIFLGNVS